MIELSPMLIFLGGKVFYFFTLEIDINFLCEKRGIGQDWIGPIKCTLPSTAAMNYIRPVTSPAGLITSLAIQEQAHFTFALLTELVIWIKLHFNAGKYKMSNSTISAKLNQRGLLTVIVFLRFYVLSDLTLYVNHCINWCVLNSLSCTSTTIAVILLSQWNNMIMSLLLQYLKKNPLKPSWVQCFFFFMSM